MGALILLLGCAPDEPGDQVDPCETASWESDEAADYGDPWDPPEVDDLPDVKLDILFQEPLDVDLEPPEPHDAPPYFADEGEVRWEFDPQAEIYFRRVTEAEILEHGWQFNDVLVLMPELLDAIRSDQEHLIATLPFYDRRETAYDETLRHLLSIELQNAGEFRPGFIIDRNREPRTPQVQRETFAYYAPSNLPSGTHVVEDGRFLARLTSDHEQALHLRGVGLGRRFSLRGPIGYRTLTWPSPLTESVYLLSSDFDPLDASSFSVMRPTSHAADIITETDGVEQCTDGLDNDNDSVGDECDYECHVHPDFAGPGNTDTILAYENSKSFGIFGDLLYCAIAADYWEVELATTGMEAAQFLNWVDGGGTDDNNVFRAVTIACDVRDPDIAAACHDDAICTGDLSSYPLAGVGFNLHKSEGESEDSYVELAWSTGDWYVEARGSAPPMHAIVVAAQQNDPPDPNSGTAGSAFSNRLNKVYTKIGAAAVNVVANSGYLRVAHELGHTMGLPHDTGFYVRGGDGLELPGFMNDGGGTQPVLGSPDPTEDWWGRIGGIDAYQPAQIWTGSVPSPNWPRSSGFGYTGCEGDMCDYFHGLSCNGFECTGPLQ